MQDDSEERPLLFFWGEEEGGDRKDEHIGLAGVRILIVSGFTTEAPTISIILHLIGLDLVLLTSGIMHFSSAVLRLRFLAR